MKLIRIAAAGVLAALALAGCAGNPMASSGAGASGESIVVGSANFPESELLADIYAEALKAKGCLLYTSRCV